MRISDWSSDVCSSDLIDAPALAFGRLAKFPCTEIFALGQDDDIAPPIVQKGQAPFLDGGKLRGPESIAIAKIALVAEQVGDDRQPARLDVEQRMTGLARTAADTPETGRTEGGETGVQ